MPDRLNISILYLFFPLALGPFKSCYVYSVAFDSYVYGLLYHCNIITIFDSDTSCCINHLILIRTPMFIYLKVSTKYIYIIDVCICCRLAWGSRYVALYTDAYDYSNIARIHLFISKGCRKEPDVETAGYRPCCHSPKLASLKSQGVDRQ